MNFRLHAMCFYRGSCQVNLASFWKPGSFSLVPHWETRLAHGSPSACDCPASLLYWKALARRVPAKLAFLQYTSIIVCSATWHEGVLSLQVGKTSRYPPFSYWKCIYHLCAYLVQFSASLCKKLLNRRSTCAEQEKLKHFTP